MPGDRDGVPFTLPPWEGGVIATDPKTTVLSYPDMVRRLRAAAAGGGGGSACVGSLPLCTAADAQLDFHPSAGVAALVASTRAVGRVRVDFS